MQDIIKKVVHDAVAQQEKIIKEIAEQGYKFLVIKKEYNFEDNTAKCNYKYKGFNSKEGLEELLTEGYEIYDLAKVHEYLKGLKPEGN